MYLKTKQEYFLSRQLFLGLIVFALIALFAWKTQNAKALTSITLISSYTEEDSTTTNYTFHDNTTSVNYSSGDSVVLSACSDSYCRWIADDAVRITVTRPDYTTDGVYLSSLAIWQDEVDLTDLFLSGTNSVYVEVIDVITPKRSLSQTLYLVQSTTPPPDPDMDILSIFAELLAFLGPNVNHSGDPVNTFTGDFTYMYEDIAITGLGPTPSFVRTYNSGNDSSSDIGVGWTHNYNMRLYRPSSSSDDVVVFGPQGRADLYTYNSGDYEAPDGVTATLVEETNGSYTLTAKDQSSWVFNEIGLLTHIKNRYGNQSVLTYNSNNQVISISDPTGRGNLVFEYNNDSLLESVTDWMSREVSFEYDAFDRLITVTDREGEETDYGYDGTSHRLTTITDALGHVVVTNTYDGNGRVATQKDAVGLVSGQTTTFNYVINGNDSRTTTITYSKTSHENTWNYVEVHIHDEDGNATQEVRKPLASPSSWITTTMSYDSNGFMVSATDGLENTTNYCYDVDYEGNNISGSYGMLTRKIEPAPSSGADRPVMLYAYDSHNNLIQEIPPLGVDSGATVTCSTDLSDDLDLVYAIDYDYDSATGTLLEAVSSYYADPDTDLGVTATTIYAYTDTNNLGLVTKTIPPRGNASSPADEDFATTYLYGQAGMLTTVTAPTNAVTTYGYDAVGRMTSMVEPRGNESGATASHYTREYVYDDEDRQTFVKAPAPAVDGSQLVTEYQYDAVGNQTIVIDANGQVVKYEYDVRDQVEHVLQSPDTWTNPSSLPTNVITTTYEYDHLGFMTSMIRADGSSDERVTDYEYDGLGRVMVETQYPNWPSTTSTLVTSYTYDANSNVLTMVDPLNQTTSYGYDNLNRLIEIDYSDAGTPNVDYTYDFHGNRLTMMDGTGTTSYTYDEWNRLEEVTSPGSVEVGYRYDRHSNRNELIYPDNESVTYTFDEADRMTTVEDWDNRETTYYYLVNGQVEVLTHDNGTTAHHSYDNAGRMTRVWNMYGTDTINRYTYSIDATGYITHTDEVVNDGDPDEITSSRLGTIDFEYDGMYRLLREHRDLPFPQDNIVYQYTYDPVGNRLSRELLDGGDLDVEEETQYEYDMADRIVEATGDNDEKFTVDANGNIIDRYVYTFWRSPHEYDQANRLAEIDLRSSIFTYFYEYDGDGNRTLVQRQSGFSPVDLTSYIYDVSRPLPVVLQDTWHPFPSETRKYVWGLSLLYMVEGNDAYFYHTDNLGSVRAVTDEDSDMVLSEEYEAFGLEDDSSSSLSTTQPYKFAGEVDDESFGDVEYIYLRTRHYDPNIGRFLSQDSFSGNNTSPLTLNRYSYVENNPANLVDPSGHSSNRALQCNESNTAYGFIEAEMEAQEKALKGMTPLQIKIHGVVFGLPSIEGYFNGGLTERIRIQLEDAGFDCMEYRGHIWDTSSYGNVVFGYHVTSMGAPCAFARVWGHADQWAKNQDDPERGWDPPDDQSQIVHGCYR